MWADIQIGQIVEPLHRNVLVNFECLFEALAPKCVCVERERENKFYLSSRGWMSSFAFWALLVLEKQWGRHWGSLVWFALLQGENLHIYDFGKGKFEHSNWILRKMYLKAKGRPLRQLICPCGKGSTLWGPPQDECEYCDFFVPLWRASLFLGVFKGCKRYSCTVTKSLAVSSSADSLDFYTSRWVLG